MSQIGNWLMMMLLSRGFNKAIFLVLLAVVYMFNQPLYAATDPKTQAVQCSLIASKLDRLGCFDQLFPAQQNLIETASLDNIKVNKSSRQVPQPEYWQQLMNAQQTSMQSSFVLQQVAAENHSGALSQQGMWAFAPAIGQASPRPILLLSCIDNISRVELLLPKAIKQTEALIWLENSAGRFSQQWFLDESGYVLRSGRGLPAISLMKNMIKKQRFSMISNLYQVNDLSFDSEHLSTIIAPMRKMCRW